MSDRRNYTFPLTPSGADGASHPLSSHARAESSTGRRFFKDGAGLSSTDANQGLGVDHSTPHINADGDARLTPMPEISRSSMVPSPIDRRPVRRLWRKIWSGGKSSEVKRGSEPGLAQAIAGEAQEKGRLGWRRVAWLRRMVVGGMVRLEHTL